MHAKDLLKEVTTIFITSTIVWSQVRQKGGNTAPPINRNWIKDLLSKAPLFLCIDHSGRLSYLSLLFFGTLHSNGCICSFSLLFFTSFLFSAICKASSDNHFAFLCFFFVGMVLITASYKMSGTSIHTFSGTLSDLIP